MKKKLENSAPTLEENVNEYAVIVISDTRHLLKII